jgi:hypothetical protein
MIDGEKGCIGGFPGARQFQLKHLPCVMELVVLASAVLGKMV